MTQTQHAAARPFSHADGKKPMPRKKKSPSKSSRARESIELSRVEIWARIDRKDGTPPRFERVTSW